MNRARAKASGALYKAEKAYSVDEFCGDNYGSGEQS